MRGAAYDESSLGEIAVQVEDYVRRVGDKHADAGAVIGDDGGVGGDAAVVGVQCGDVGPRWGWEDAEEG
jgi:hypothetical protein